MPKKKIPKGYDSGLEHRLHKGVLRDWIHHPERIPYVSRHTYQPDFKLGGTLVEAKGRFRTSAEARKYIDIRDALPPDRKLVFIFSDSNKPMPNAKKRKCGTKFTHGEWADKNSFVYYCEKRGLPKEIK